MKTKLSVSILICCLSIYRQENVDFKQKAFELYKDSIINKTTSKINIVVKIQDYNYWKSDCTEKFTLKWQDTMVGGTDNLKVKNIILGTDNKFKIINKFNRVTYLITTICFHP